MKAVRARCRQRFWWYAGFTALNMTGYATFAVLAYHLPLQATSSLTQRFRSSTPLAMGPRRARRVRLRGGCMTALV